MLDLECPEVEEPMREVVRSKDLSGAGAGIEALRKRWELAGDATVYVCKTNTFLWVADALVEALPGVKMVGIIRDPKAVVASMLRQPNFGPRMSKGWRKLPARSFGGRKERELEGLSPAGRAAAWWRAWNEELRRVQKRHGVPVVKFEELVKHPKETAAWLSKVVGFEVPAPKVDRGVLVRWQRVLSCPDKRVVDRIVRGFI